jgi:3-oxoacyl-[acyl-carrier protein] reductase
MTDLQGQVALVTGASRGIGRAIAIRLGQLGANVVVNYSRDAAGASETVNTIETAGSLAIDVRADVSKPTEIEALFQACQARFAGVDIVVANAGVDEPGGVIADVTEADYDRMYGAPHPGPQGLLRWQRVQQLVGAAAEAGQLAAIAASTRTSTTPVP